MVNRNKDVILTRGENYTFETVGTMVLGGFFSNVELSCILDYKTARMLSGVDEIHSIIYPMLKSLHDADPTLEEPSSDIANFTFYQFDVGNGQNLVIAYEWIKANTLKDVELNNIDFTIENISPGKINLIKTYLGAIGISHYTTTVY